jgi:hypothetical protein
LSIAQKGLISKILNDGLSLAEKEKVTKELLKIALSRKTGLVSDIVNAYIEKVDFNPPEIATSTVSIWRN